MAGPAIQIAKPEKFVGRPRRSRSRRGARRRGLEHLTSSSSRTASSSRSSRWPIRRAPRSSRTAPIGWWSPVRSGSRRCPSCKSGSAAIIVTAARKVLYGIRTVESTARRDFKVRLERPRVVGASRRTTTSITAAPRWSCTASRRTTSTSGVLVGDVEYPGYPATGAALEGVKIADPAAARGVLRAAARSGPEDADPALRPRRGRQHGPRRLRLPRVPEAVQAQPHRRSTTSCSIASCRPSSKARPEVKPDGDTLAKFLVINGELRQKNNEKIASLAAQTQPEMLWRGVVFHPFGNTAVESAFADHRTYIYKGKEVDQQVHLGFDLASFAGTPIVAANRGKVALRRGARHLRQLRDHRSRHGRAVALRPPLVDRREGRADRSRRNSRSAAAA